MSDVPETETLAEAVRAIVAESEDHKPLSTGGTVVDGWWRRKLRAALAAHDTPPPNVIDVDGCETCARWVACHLPINPARTQRERDAFHDSGHTRRIRTGCPGCDAYWDPQPSSLGDVSDSEPKRDCDTCGGPMNLVEDDPQTWACPPCGAIQTPPPEGEQPDPEPRRWICEKFDTPPFPDAPAEGGQPDADDELLAELDAIADPGIPGYIPPYADVAARAASALRRKRDSHRIVYEQNEAYYAELSRQQDRLAARADERDAFRRNLTTVLAENERLERELAEAGHREDRLVARIHELGAKLTTAEHRLAEARSGLQHINRHGCEHYTSGSCLTDPSRSRDAEYGADQWCDPCIAADALGKKENSR